MAKATETAAALHTKGDMATDTIAENIALIADGVRRLRSGKLNDRALFVLIQHAAPGSISKREIKAVFDGIDALQSTYLRKAAP